MAQRNLFERKWDFKGASKWMRKREFEGIRWVSLENHLIKINKLALIFHILIENGFLDKLSKVMLWNILAGTNNLDSFCNDIKERIKNYIENEEILKCSYDDNDFKKAIQFTEKNQAQKPFLSHIRKMQDKKMGESHFKMLQNNFDIPLKILQKLQNSNRTIVTTSDPSKRKKLTIILQECYEN